MNNAAILFPGLACAAVATAFGALAHLRSQKDKAAAKLASLDSTPDSSWADGMGPTSQCVTEAGCYNQAAYATLVGRSTDIGGGTKSGGGKLDNGAAMDNVERVGTAGVVLQASSPCIQSIAQGSRQPPGGVEQASAVRTASLHCALTTAVMTSDPSLSTRIRSADDLALRSEQTLDRSDLETASEHCLSVSDSKPENVGNAGGGADERCGGVNSWGGETVGGHIGVDVYADVDGDAVGGASSGRARGVVLADAGSR